MASATTKPTDTQRECLSSLERAVDLFNIAREMAPEGSPLAKLLGVAYIQLASGTEDLAASYGLEIAMP